MRTLLLTPWYFPHKILRWQDAITMIYKGTVDVVAEYDETICSPSTSIKAPAVLRLRRPIGAMKRGIKFSRVNIYTRDGFKCFGAGTRILMANGSQKLIELISVGDKIIDAYGEIQTVTAVGSKVSDNAVSLKSSRSFDKTITTFDHPFLTDSGEFVEIGKRPNKLVFPRLIKYDLINHIYDVSSNISSNVWMRIKNGRLFWTRRSNEVGFPAYLTPSSKFAYLLGLYCAEGSATKQGLIQFSFGEHEKDTLAKDALIGLIELGLNPIIDIYESSANTRACSVIFSKILNKECGKGAKNKQAPFSLIGIYHRDFLKGLFFGDGYIRHSRKKIVLTMVSRQIIEDAISMLWGLGVFPTLHMIDRKEPKPGSRSFKTSRSYSLVFSGLNYIKFMTEVMGENILVSNKLKPIEGNDRFIYRKITNLEKIDELTPVYNLETTGSHSYIANGMSVHNCQYCGEKFKMKNLSYDHVIPRQAGGRTVWENIVTSCKPCNNLKANRTCDESGLFPIHSPIRPKALQLTGPTFNLNNIPEEWVDFCQGILDIG